MLWVVDHIIKIGNAVGMQVQLVNVTSIGNDEAVQLEYTTKQLSIYNIIYNGVVAVFTGEKRSDVTRLDSLIHSFTHLLTHLLTYSVLRMRWVSTTSSTSPASPPLNGIHSVSRLHLRI